MDIKLISVAFEPQNPRPINNTPQWRTLYSLASRSSSQYFWILNPTVEAAMISVVVRSVRALAFFRQSVITCPPPCGASILSTSDTSPLISGRESCRI